MDVFQVIEAGDADRLRDVVAAEPQAAAARNEAGLSAVLTAQYRHRRDLVDILLAANPDLDVFDAAAVGDVTRLRTLLDGDPGLATAYASDGHFPLGLAAYFGHPDAVELLLERGADVAAVARNPMQVQALHAAVAGRNTVAVRLLLEAGADPNATQHGGWTPLMAAAAHGDEAIVDLLLAAGATPDEAASEQAMNNGHHELAARLSGNRSTTS
jgi:ankyrin repeat protein